MLGTTMSTANVCNEDGYGTDKRDPCSSPPCKRLKQASLPFQIIHSPQEITRPDDFQPVVEASTSSESFTSDQEHSDQDRQSNVNNPCNKTTQRDTESVEKVNVDIGSQRSPSLPCATSQPIEKSPISNTSADNSGTSSPNSSFQSNGNLGSILNFIKPTTSCSNPDTDNCRTPFKYCENMVVRKSTSPNPVVSPAASASSESFEPPCPTSPLASKQKLNTPKGRTPGRKLCVEEKLKREEEKLRKQKEKENLEQERVQKKKEKERIKMEKEKERQEAKQKKEQEKLEQLAQKKQKEKERQEKKELEEKEKRERMEIKEEKRKKREEEKKRREDEKNLRNEEKRKKEEEEMLKKKKIQNNFASFFIKKDITSAPKQKELVRNETKFQPFELKPFMKLANVIPCKPLSEEAQEAFNEILTEQITSSIHQVKEELQKIKAELVHDREMQNSSVKNVDDLNQDNHDILIEKDIPDGTRTKAKDRNDGIRPKLLQFHDNYRPAYFGTWRKKSLYIGPRTPFKKDMDLINYDVDSDEEWEEEEPGESLSNSEGEEEDDDNNNDENDGENDGFLVPHGYLSDDEGVDNVEDDEADEKDGLKSENQQQHKDEDRMERQLAKQKAWEAEMKRQFKPMKPVAIGCCWTGDIPSILNQLEACCLVSGNIDPYARTENTVPSSPNANPPTYCNTAMPVPEEAMPSLIKLVHGNTAGLHKLICMFRKKWTLETKEGETSETNWEEHCVISKRQLERKITTIAKKEIRSTMPKARWYVHNRVLTQYNMEDISLPSNGHLVYQNEKTSPRGKIGSTPTIQHFTQNLKNSEFPRQNGINLQVQSYEINKENLMDTSPV